MKKEIVFKVIRYLGTVLGVFNAIMFFALRPCWSGISSTLGYKGNPSNEFLYFLPIVICVLLFLIALADLILKAIFDKKWLDILFLSISVIFLVAIIVIIALGAIDYMRFVWPNFFIGVATALVILLIYALLFIYPKTVLKDSRLFKIGTLALSGVVAVGLLTHFSINRITYKPVVYAVEKNYQIVFSSHSESLGWVEVGDKCYYDTYAGSTKKYGKVHKISVPMEALDAAKKYTVHSQHSIYAGPFGGFLGRDISETVEFTPVNSEDGIQYLSFSDIHMNDRQAVKTASYVTNYDFLILAGDMISDVETFDDANFINLVANEITGGQKPVIYARGNHDVKGRYGEQMHNFAGANGEKFYYTFYFKDVYGVVLDLGEDHDDDWWEYYGTAHYEEYHEEQLQFLQNEIDKHEYDDYKYHLAAVHIPIPFVNYRHNHENVKKNMTELLNQMDIDMMVTGHQHQLMIFEPGLVTPYEKLKYNTAVHKDKTYNGYLTDFNFPCFMVSKQGLDYFDDTTITGAKSHIGMVTDVDLVNEKETVYYLNSKGEKVDLYMFACWIAASFSITTHSPTS